MDRRHCTIPFKVCRSGFHSASKTRRSPNVSSMLADRLRRWPDSDPTLGQCLVFSQSCSGMRHTFDSGRQCKLKINNPFI